MFVFQGCQAQLLGLLLYPSFALITLCEAAISAQAAVSLASPSSASCSAGPLGRGLQARPTVGFWHSNSITPLGSKYLTERRATETSPHPPFTLALLCPGSWVHVMH